MKNFFAISMVFLSLTGCAFFDTFNPFYSETKPNQEKPLKEPLEEPLKEETQENKAIQQKKTQANGIIQREGEKQDAAQPIQRQERQVANNNPAIRKYTECSKQELMQAIKNVLYLMDTKNAKIIQQDNAVINYRYYADTVNNKYIFGYDTWVINIEEQNDKSFAVSVMVGTAQEINSAPSSSLQPKTPDELYFNINALDEAQSALFFERVEYFLGRNPHWRTCENIQNWVKENNYKGKFQNTAVTNSSDLPFICGHNWYGIEDRDPSFLEK